MKRKLGIIVLGFSSDFFLWRLNEHRAKPEPEKNNIDGGRENQSGQ